MKLSTMVGLTLLLLTLVITSSLPVFASAEVAKDCKLHFVIYGDPRCPHCRATNRTLNALLPNCVKFIDIEDNVTALQIYANLWDAVIRSPAYSVPFTVVYSDNRPLAFIVGERPEEWWKQLIANLTAQPPETALLCPDMSCRSLTLQEYRAAIAALKRLVKVVYVVAYEGFNRELLESSGAMVLNESPPEAKTVVKEAMKLLNVSEIRGYAIYCGLRPLVLLVDKNVTHTIVAGGKTVDLDKLIINRAAQYTVARGEPYPVIVYVFMKDNKPLMRVVTVKPNEKIELLLDKVCGTPSSQKTLMPLPALIAALIGLAALDSVNPCFLALYTTLVAASASLGGSSAALATGLAIAAGVYTGYYLLGLGLSQALSILGEPLRFILAIVMLLLGFRAIGEALQLRERGSERECKVCRLVEEKGKFGILGLYGLGLIASWTLLPCTAGPYVAAIMLLGGQPLFLRLVLLALYNLVFIAPLIAILVGATRIAKKYEKLMPAMSAVAGVILVALAILIILESLDIIPPII